MKPKIKNVADIRKPEPAKKVKRTSEPVGIAAQIAKAVRSIVGEDVRFSVEHPQNMDWGDFSTNVGIITKKSQEIVAALKADKQLTAIVFKTDVAGAGFINISIRPEALVAQTEKICKGKFQTRWTGKKVSVEYTDPNPFKEFHLGHLYSNLIGESIAHIFEAAGAAVWRGDFYGDAGMHIAKSVWGMMEKMKAEGVALEDLEKLPLKDRQKFMGQGYALGVTTYDEDTQIAEKIKDINYMVYVAAQEELELTRRWCPIVNYRKYIEGNLEKYPEIKAVYTAGLRWSLEYFETYYTRLGTKFDGYYPESWVGEYGVQMVEKGLKMGVLEKSDGAVVFKGEKYGLHTRVFLNKLGLPTYEAKDLGLAKAKYGDFKYDYSLNVFGREIDEYYYVVKKAMELIEPELGAKANHLAHGMVKLPEGKMSSRSGNVITVEWLLNEAKRSIKKAHKCSDATAEIIGQGAVKYGLLKSSIGTDVIFDFDKNISLEGNSGPYLQYTYTRAHSVLAKSNYQTKLEMGASGQSATFKIPPLNHEEEILLRTLYRFEEVVVQAADTLAPNLIAEFLYDLAQKFNSFYNKHRVIGNDFRLWLTAAAAAILKQGLGLLGITAPEKM